MLCSILCAIYQGGDDCWGTLKQPKFAFAALREARAIFLKKGIDVETLDRDLQNEWERLFEGVK